MAADNLISFGFRKKRQQADSCDVSLTSTPATTISATDGAAFISQSFEEARFLLAIRFPSLPSRASRPRHGPIIAECRLDEERFLKSPGILHPVFDDWHGLHIERDYVGLHARRNASDLVLKTHGRRRSPCCHVLGVAGGQRVTVELGGLIGFIECCEDGERRPSTQFRSELNAYRPFLLHGALNVEVSEPRSFPDGANAYLACGPLHWNRRPASVR